MWRYNKCYVIIIIITVPISAGIHFGLPEYLHILAYHAYRGTHSVPNPQASHQIPEKKSLNSLSVSDIVVYFNMHCL